MRELVLVAGGGAIGATARFLLSGAVTQLVPVFRFPVATCAVNLLGCFIVGVLLGIHERTAAMSQETRLFLVTGILGGFTTFSTFGAESLQLMQRHEWIVLAGYLAISVMLGILLVWGGWVIGQR
jgi:CrcB protein